jgi:glycogen(starch) synthase
MRLTFITNLYPPYIVGGNEMLCHDVVTALRARGHQVSVVCGRGRALPDDVDGVLPLDLDRKEETFLGGRAPGLLESFRLHVFDPATWRAVRAALRRLRPDVVVVWNLYMASAAPLVAVRAAGLPAVTHVCDKWLDVSLRDAGPVLRLSPRAARAVGSAQRAILPWLRRAARPSRIVAISAFIKSFYERSGHPAADIDVIHLGVPLDEPTEQERRGRSGPLRLLYVGGLWEGKGPQTAVRALGILKRAGHAGLRLDVCGTGTPGFVAWLRGVIAEEDVGEEVRLRGFVDRAVVRALCLSHDVLLFPSQWDEPFAAVPVEAMSAGMAIVATTAGGTPEAVTDGETGLLVPPADPAAMADAIRRLIESPGLRQDLGARAAAVARERFGFDRYIDRLEAAYRSLLPGESSRSHPSRP